MAPNRKKMGRQIQLMLIAGLWTGIVLAGSLSAHLFAQAPPEEKTPSGLRKALDQLTSSNHEDWEKSEVALMRLKNEGDMRPMALCGLALFYTKENKVEAIEKFCAVADTTFPSAGPDLRAYVLRLQLWLDLVEEDRLEATKHFSELADLALSKELSQASRDAISALLGNVMGLLESKTAISPIEPEALAAVRKKLFDRKEFAASLKPRYRIASLYAVSVEKWFQQHANVLSNDLKAIAQQDLKESQSQLTKALTDYSDRCHEKDDLVFDRRKTNNLFVPLNNQIAAVVLLWRQNPHVHNPIEPNRNAISVPTTERRDTGRTKKVTSTRWVTRNGKREEETYEEDEEIYETVRRDQRDIDRDIDVIYLPRLNYYRSLVSFRDEMQTRRKEIDKKKNAVHAEIVKIEALIESKKEEIRIEHQELKELKFEKRILEACNKSLEAGAPKFAFRPQVYEVFDFVAEKNVILESRRIAQLKTDRTVH